MYANSDKKAFIVYNSYSEAIKDFSLENKGRLFQAMLDYSINGVEPPANSPIKVAFNFIKIQLDIDIQKWQAIAERNSENGKKGGRPSNSKKPRKPTGLFGNPEKPKKAVEGEVDVDVDVEVDVDVDNKKINIKKETSEILETYNKLWGKSAKSSRAWEANYIKWRNDYSFEEIKAAVGNMKWHSWIGSLSDAFKLESFFRTDKDWIGDCKDLKKPSHLMTAEDIIAKYRD